MRMDLTVVQLRTVVAVHDAGGFTAAAATLLQAQSSLSRTVLEVERKLGVSLFTRTTRHLEPTAEGREFVAIARATIATFDANLAHFAGFLDGQRGRVRVATLPSLAAILLPAVVSRYQVEHPEVTLSIEDALAAEVLDRVRRGVVDFAVTSCRRPRPNRRPGRHRRRHRPVLLRVPATPPLRRIGRGGVVGTREGGVHRVRPDDRTTSIRQHLDRAFAAAAARPRNAIEARNISAVAGLVAAGLGVSAVPGLVLPLTRFAGLDHRPLGDPAAERRIAVVRVPNRPLSPAADAFRTAITAPGEHRPPLPSEATWTLPA